MQENINNINSETKVDIAINDKYIVSLDFVFKNKDNQTNHLTTTGIQVADGYILANLPSKLLNPDITPTNEDFSRVTITWEWNKKKVTLTNKAAFISSQGAVPISFTEDYFIALITNEGTTGSEFNTDISYPKLKFKRIKNIPGQEYDITYSYITGVWRSTAKLIEIPQGKYTIVLDGAKQGGLIGQEPTGGAIVQHQENNIISGLIRSYTKNDKGIEWSGSLLSPFGAFIQKNLGIDVKCILKLELKFIAPNNDPVVIETMGLQIKDNYILTNIPISKFAEFNMNPYTSIPSEIKIYWENSSTPEVILTNENAYLLPPAISDIPLGLTCIALITSKGSNSHFSEGLRYPKLNYEPLENLKVDTTGLIYFYHSSGRASIHATNDGIISSHISLISNATTTPSIYTGGPIIIPDNENTSNIVSALMSKIDHSGSHTIWHGILLQQFRNYIKGLTDEGLFIRKPLIINSAEKIVEEGNKGTALVKGTGTPDWQIKAQVVNESSWSLASVDSNGNWQVTVSYPIAPDQIPPKAINVMVDHLTPRGVLIDKVAKTLQL